MFQILIGIISIIIGIIMIMKYKKVRYIPCPEPQPSIKETTFNYGTLFSGIILVILGIMIIIFGTKIVF